MTDRCTPAPPIGGKWYARKRTRFTRRLRASRTRARLARERRPRARESGTSSMTTEFAPTTAPRPMRTPGQTTTFWPSQAPSPISTGSDVARRPGRGPAGRCHRRRGCGPRCRRCGRAAPCARGGRERLPRGRSCPAMLVPSPISSATSSPGRRATWSHEPAPTKTSRADRDPMLAGEANRRLEDAVTSERRERSRREDGEPLRLSSRPQPVDAQEEPAHQRASSAPASVRPPRGRRWPSMSVRG